ncbi:hypothetical protein SAMN04489712_12337 [Thermomonospora echinospora]|uniref:Uncharacterized protein n=1 Tax=Thermomonospora echinospora TaxID=1992 RepID=A0A1H6DV93_9ACTN|nr:hypothetical protein [Thermomonospora echinospora]SEG89180.1 hypothetical protein SAMN04489712_12337 [Thermomonospora echinospora]
MKTRRRAPGRRSGWLRFLGYGGSTLLVLAAVAVLALPLLGGGRDAGASAGPQTTGDPRTAAGPQGAGGRQQPSAAGDPRRPSGQGDVPDPRQDPLGQAGGGDQGPEMPLPGGGARDYCPRGLGAVQYGMTGLTVTVQLRGAAFVQVEVHLQGLTSLKQTTQVKGGRPHTFVFRQATADRVERIQVRSMGTTVPQTCDLRLT